MLKDYNTRIGDINVKCAWKIILLHVYEKTIDNNNYTFTSVSVSEEFGCLREGASHILARGVKHGDYKLADKSTRPYVYKLTNAGKQRAKRIMNKYSSGDV